MLLQAWFLGMARRLPPRRRLWRRPWARGFGGVVALALLLGPTAGPLAAWVGLPVTADACLCPPERCRCPHDAPVAHRPARHDGAAAAAADAGSDCASRASCPLRGKRATVTHAAGRRTGRGQAGGAAASEVAAGHGLHRASAGHSAHRTVSPQQTASPERLASRRHPTSPAHLASPEYPASTGHLAVPQHVDDGGPERLASSAAVPPSPAGCSIASRCGGDAPPAGTGTMTWLQAAGGAGAGWAAPFDAGDPAPPAAAARLLDALRSPDPPPPRRIAPIA